MCIRDRADGIKIVENLFKSTKKIKFNLDTTWDERLEELKDILQAYPGETPVSINCRLQEYKKQVELRPYEPKSVAISFELFNQLHRAFGELNFLTLR